MAIGGKNCDIAVDDLLRLGRDNSIRNPEAVIVDVVRGAADFE